jgi:K+-transporting ATPase KdpF subunit
MQINRALRHQASAATLDDFRSEHSHDGRHYGGTCRRLLRGVDRLRLRLRTALRRDAMIFDYSLAGIVTAGLLIYLIYALLKPELF